MEDRPYIAFRRLIETGRVLWLIVILSMGIRFYYSFHLFVSDEVFNLIIIEDLVAGEGLGDYFFRHPPLYLLLSSLVSFFVGSYPQVPSFISIVFSALSLIPIYRIADYLMGRTVALWASVFLAFMPANIYYSSWIKQDSMLLFFFSWSIYFYLRGRYLPAGAAIGAALLIKEFAILFFPLSFFITFLEVKKRRDNRGWYPWIKMSLVAAALSGWWYLMFGGSFYGIAGEALTGGNIKELAWHLPWWFYAGNMTYDLSYPSFLLFLTGSVSIVIKIVRQGPLTVYAVPLAWLLVFYLPLSVITVKTPWYTYLATPSMALICSYGLIGLTGLLQSRRVKLLVYLGVSVSLLFVVYNYSNDKFYERFPGNRRSQLMKDIQGDTWRGINEKKRFWRNRMKGVGKVGFLEFNPTLIYLMGLKDDKIVMAGFGKFMVSDREGLLKKIKDYDIEAFVINTESVTYTKKNLNDMLSLWGEPERVEPLLVFLIK